VTTKSRQTYSIPEVADIVGIGTRTAYELARTGKLPFEVLAIGGRLVVPRHQVHDWLEGKTREAAS
jgi:excisionase family DNA binding protein